MSGGTWDFREKLMKFLAEDVREGLGRDGETLLELPAARAAIADVMTVVADLLTELDHHFTGDGYVESEAVWISVLPVRLDAALQTHRQIPD